MDILEEVLLPSIRTYALPAPEHIYLVQDNCPVHTGRVVQDWFQEHPEITRLFWPARSPDLNPIENMWGCMVNEWVHTNEQTRDALERHVREVWESFRRRPQYCESLVRSMTRRIDAVREANGYYTKY